MCKHEDKLFKGMSFAMSDAELKEFINTTLFGGEASDIPLGRFIIRAVSDDIKRSVRAIKRSQKEK